MKLIDCAVIGYREGLTYISEAVDHIKEHKDMFFEPEQCNIELTELDAEYTFYKFINRKTEKDYIIDYIIAKGINTDELNDYIIEDLYDDWIV